MKQHDFAVSSQSDIAFDRIGTEVQGSLNCGGGVLGKIAGGTSMTHDPWHDGIVSAFGLKTQACPRRVRAEAQ